jgi:hypothetical protein
MSRISQKIFTGNSTWTAQAGVYFVEIEAIGAGGGGGGGRDGTALINQSPLGGGGGGAGIMQRITMPVVPGTLYGITIGTGGTAGALGAPPGALPSAGGAGSDTIFSISGGTILAVFVGGGGGYATNDVQNSQGYNNAGGSPASNPLAYAPGNVVPLGTLISPNCQPRIMIGEGGIGGESNLQTWKLYGTAGSNYVAYNAAAFAGGAAGATGTDNGGVGGHHGGGPGGGGAASYYGSGGAGGNGGNGSAAGGSPGSAGTAPGGTAYGAGGGGGGAGGCGTSGGSGANGAAGAAGYLVLRWKE